MQNFDEPMNDGLFRTMLPAGVNGRTSNPRCDAITCERTTREGKPYCSDHVELSPYVKGVMEELALRDTEARALANDQPIKRDGHLVRETLLMLEQGAYTSAKLSRLMDIPHDSTETLIRIMAREGLAKMSKTDRGALVISRILDPNVNTRYNR